MNARVLEARDSCIRLLVLVALAMAINVARGDTAELPAGTPGRLVNIGTHSLYLLCEGHGSPVVVFENGLGGLHFEWKAVVERLQDRQRVCRYDRAGYGWSTPGPLPRNTSRITDELHAMLRAAGEPGPYLLVGHSFGGYTAQLFARRYPSQTAGVVLVDASHPQQVQRYLAPPLHVNTAPSRRGRIVHSRSVRLPERFPAGSAATAYELLMQPRMRFAVAEEFFEFRASAAAVDRARAFPPVPLMVVTHGRRIWPDNALGEKCEALWADLQAELAGLTRLSAHVIANDSGHHVQLDQPRLVADAIRLVAGTAQQMARNARSERRLASGNRVAEAKPLAPAVDGTGLLDDYLWLAFEGATWRRDALHQSLTMRPGFASLGDTSLRNARLSFQQQLDAMNPARSFSAGSADIEPRY